ncbi:MAG: methylated-DNA--[protein]-cysteine S-methyltransferase [Gammaproteobacteria bacterium]|nr:methylated-DNA--[protein]-cysteine S-methyltransferase [Gammaproteobacteria bacterium]
MSKHSFSKVIAMRKIDLIPPPVRARLEDRDRTPARGRSLTAGFASSPLGRLMLAEVDGALCRVGYVDGNEDRQWRRLARRWPGANLRRDDEWAQGRADSLFSSGDDSVEVLLRGTAFQLDVWQALLGVPAGSTESYGGLALRARKPGASRAVGGAMNANPVAWLVPCHRVVAGDGGLCGYGGGLNRKQRLLAAEAAGTA